MNAIKTISKNGLTAKIFQDEMPENPLTSWDIFHGKFICFHKRYDLGHKHEFSFSNYSSWEEMKKAIMKEYKTDVILPLYLYDHSGITMNTTGFSCGWDSGQVGFIVLDKEQMKSIQGWKVVTKERKEKLLQFLKEEVATYDQYLTGDVYGYKIEDSEGNETDSCWGFYGMEQIEEEVNGILEVKQVA